MAADIAVDANGCLATRRHLIGHRIADRLAQVVSNVIDNAIQHGRGSPLVSSGR
jgi:signal transduction histidine kinase